MEEKMKCPCCGSALITKERVIKTKQIKEILNVCEKCSYMTIQAVPDETSRA